MALEGGRRGYHRKLKARVQIGVDTGYGPSTPRESTAEESVSGLCTCCNPTSQHTRRCMMRNIEVEEEEEEEEENQPVCDIRGDGNVDTERGITQPRDEDEDEDEEQAGLSDSEVDLRNHLRDDILETVDECLSAWEKNRAPVADSPPNPLHRCVVCTLPFGGCEHTQKWLDGRDRQAILDPLPKDSVDLTMDDISDVLAPASLASDGVTVDTTSDPSLANLRWETLSPQPADQLSGEKVDLSSPSSRSGHTMVLLDRTGSLVDDNRVLVLFGGISTTNTKTRQDTHTPTHTHTHHSAMAAKGSNKSSNTRSSKVPQHTLHYHTDVRVFNMGLSTWHCPEATGDLPSGRYGHVALALDSETMWMFGGRLRGGLQASDTYTLNVRDMRWDRTNAGGDGDVGPSARFWSAAVKVGQRILLFGGADLLTGRNFDDVWTWEIQTRSWTEQIVVGTPPPARYGHVLVACAQGQVLVLGGCCVSTSAEDGLPSDNDRLHLRVRIAANSVERAYALEEAEIAVGAFDCYAELGESVPRRDRRGTKDKPSACASDREEWRRLSRRQAQLAAAIAARENDTNLREEELRDVLFEQAAMTYWAKLHSRHPLTELDMMFLDTESMIWGAGNPPAVGGGKTIPPSARMHFSAVRLGRKVVVWGGCFPTSKRIDIVEGSVHVFDLDRRRWSTAVGERHPEGMRPRLDAAVGQLRRAERALFEATQRAMTLGAPGGRTMQVVQAEAIIEVNRWRVRKIEDEIRNAIPSPLSRAAHAGCAIGHRVMYFGGWGAETEKGSILVLDIEQPREEERRLEEEFHLRLERERQQRENAEAEALRRAARLEERRKALELAREAAETAVMIAEDARSAIAELTIAPTPRLRCANSTTIWLEWERPTTDAKGKAPDRCVEYTLYMSGGFRAWEVGDEVLVEYLSRAQRKAVTSKSSITTCSLTDASSLAGGSLTLGAVSSVTPAGRGDESLGQGHQDQMFSMFSTNDEESAESSVGHNSLPKFLPAVITGTSSAADGLFDIRWNDGERERGVRRNRIHRATSPRPPWTIIYQGEECGYAVEGMIPESVIERERNFPYEVYANFSLQTKGTEVPREKLSRHSPVVTLQTNFGGQGPVDDERYPKNKKEKSKSNKKGGGVPTSVSVKARLASAKALDDSISASVGVGPQSSLSGVHHLHGQYMATGKGALYL